MSRPTPEELRQAARIVRKLDERVGSADLYSSACLDMLAAEMEVSSNDKVAGDL